MTLEEKIGQMNMPCVYVSELGRDIPAKTEACMKLAEGKLIEYLGSAGGFFTLANTILHEGTLQQCPEMHELKILLNFHHSKVFIPVTALASI